MNKFIHKIRIKLAHYQAKLLLAFLFCTLVPIISIGILSYNQSYNIAKKQITDAAVSSANQINTQINSRIAQVENVSDALQYNMYTLLQSDKMQTTDYIDRFTEVRNNIDLFKSTFNFCHIYAFLNSDQLGNNESLYFFPISQMSSLGISKRVLSQIGTHSLWLKETNIVLPYIFDNTRTPKNGIACCRAQVNHVTGTVDYAFLIFLDEDELRNILNYSGSTPVNTYIMSQSGTIIVSSSSQKDSHVTAEAAKEAVSNSNRIQTISHYVYYCLSLSNGWYQITEIPEAYIFTSTFGIIKWILLSLLLFIPLITIIILYIVRRLSFKINNLSSAMNHYQLGDFSNNEKDSIYKLPESPSDFDEVDYLCLSFENMQHSIKTNLNFIVEYKIREERLKYQLLQSQINPHFLYNILGSIQYCQSIGKLDTASLMITDLTKFYRLSLRKSGTLIMLKDELEIAESYLRIEKLCLNHIVEWDIHLEEGIENFAICKFTLQPFLENSILHGISESTPNIHIHISAAYGDSTVIIEIKDNGAGIEKEKLEELRQDLKEKSIHYDRHFGICNVNARIANRYYGNGSVTIESIKDQGTTVKIEYAQIETGELNV